MGIQLDKLINLNNSNTITVGTHDQKMHLDDVLSVAIIKMHVEPTKEVKVIRSRNPEMLAQCDIILDVGNMMPELNGKVVIDHHDKTEVYPNGIKKCSCAMLLDWMFEDTSRYMTRWYQYLLHEWVYGVSAADNGQNPADYHVKPFGNFVQLMNPTLTEPDTPAFSNKMFEKAVEVCMLFLDRHLQQYHANINIASYFENDIVNYQGNGIVCLPQIDMNKIMQYNKLAPDNKKIIVCVSYDLKYGKYSLSCVPENCATEELLVYHPVSWRGLPNTELEKETGVVGTFMCHSKGGFSIHNSFAAAFSVAQKLKEIYDRKIEQK